MQKKTWGIVAVVILIVAAGVAYAVMHKSSKPPSSNSSNTTVSNSGSTGAIVQTKTNSSVGKYLADGSGDTLYTYGADSNGVSNCSGSCLYSWPIYIATNAPATLPANVTVITRSDGSKQYAYKGLPLYTFSGDSGAGQVTGNDVNNFHVAKP